MQAIFENLPLWWQGMGMTLLLTGVVTLIGLPIGILLAGMRVSPVAALRVVAAVWTEVARNTPLTLVFFLLVFVVPRLGVVVDFQISAVVALTLYTAPFYAEAIRSGVNSVPVGQAEAARSVGLTFSQTARFVIIPQALRSVVPPLINVTIALTKNTSVAGVFFVIELFGASSRAARDHGDAVILVLLYAAALYLAITVPLGLIAGVIEKKVAVLR